MNRRRHERLWSKNPTCLCLSPRLERPNDHSHQAPSISFTSAVATSTGSSIPIFVVVRGITADYLFTSSNSGLMLARSCTSSFEPVCIIGIATSTSPSTVMTQSIFSCILKCVFLTRMATASSKIRGTEKVSSAFKLLLSYGMMTFKSPSLDWSA